jgi:hypothetical protein
MKASHTYRVEIRFGCLGTFIKKPFLEERIPNEKKFVIRSEARSIRSKYYFAKKKHIYVENEPIYFNVL